MVTEDLLERMGRVTVLQMLPLNGAAGLAVKEVFLPDNLLDYLKPADVDKECHLEYEITGSRAFLVGFSVVGHK